MSMIQTKRVPRWTTLYQPAEHSFAGTHFVADFWHGKTLEDPKELRNLLRKAAKAAHSTPLEIAVHKFAPQGLTGVIILAESHIAVHTWPEIGYLAVDVFTCGKNARPEKAIEVFKEALQPEKVEVREIQRGKMV